MATFDYLWNNSVAGGNPGQGHFATNSNPMSSATIMYINNTDAAGGGNYLEPFFAALNNYGSTARRGFIKIQMRDDSSWYQVYEFNNASLVVTGPTGYYTINIINVSPDTNFPANDTPVIISFNLAGPVGATGATGATGPIAGLDTQIIYNNSGAAAGNAALRFQQTTGVTTMSSAVVTNNLSTAAINGAAYPSVLGTNMQVLTISSSTNTLYWENNPALSLAQPNMYFVSVSGSDTTGTGNSINPYRTIQKALDQLPSGTPPQPGSIIKVFPGIYSEAITISKYRFTLVGFGDGNKAPKRVTISTPILIQTPINEPGNYTNDQLTFSDLTIATASGACVTCSNVGSGLAVIFTDCLLAQNSISYHTLVFAPTTDPNTRLYFYESAFTTPSGSTCNTLEMSAGKIFECVDTDFTNNGTGKVINLTTSKATWASAITSTFTAAGPTAISIADTLSSSSVDATSLTECTITAGSSTSTSPMISLRSSTNIATPYIFNAFRCTFLQNTANAYLKAGTLTTIAAQGCAFGTTLLAAPYSFTPYIASGIGNTLYLGNNTYLSPANLGSFSPITNIPASPVFTTYIVPSDAGSNWASWAASQNVNIANFAISNISSIVVTNNASVGTLNGVYLKDGNAGTSLAIGVSAGFANQQTGSIAIGSNAGTSNLCPNSIAIGVSAASLQTAGTQSNRIAIGTNAGYSNQLSGAIAVGSNAGNVSQGIQAIAIGWGAGVTNQGNNAIAIGTSAGSLNQPSNSIILNASESTPLNATTSGFFVAPVRNNTGITSYSLLAYSASSEVFAVSNTLPAASFGNVLRVDSIYGNDTLGAVGTYPYATISKALSVATNGQLVQIMPGTYTQTANLTISSGVAIRGAGLQSVIIQRLNATTSATMFTLGSNCRIEDVTLTLTSSSAVTPGAVYAAVNVDDGNIPSAKLRTMVINVTNNNPSGSCVGVLATGNSTNPANVTSADTLRATTININASGQQGGYAQCIRVAGSNRTSARDTNMFATATNCTAGAKVIACETISAGYLDLRASVVSASGDATTIANCSLAEISQTNASSEIILSYTRLQYHSANSFGFTPAQIPTNIVFGIFDTNDWTNGDFIKTYYLLPGTGVRTTAISNAAAAAPFVIEQDCLLRGVFLSANASLGASSLLLNVYHMDPASTPIFSLSLTGSSVATFNNTKSYTFHTGDFMYVTISGNNTTPPTTLRSFQVNVGLF
jgi:hypothetical protein